MLDVFICFGLLVAGVLFAALGYVWSQSARLLDKEREKEEAKVTEARPPIG